MDPVFTLLATNTPLPRDGWGFPQKPPAVVESAAAESLRKALLPYEDEEGCAQMIRWYYGIIRAFPEVAMGIGRGAEEYDPGLAWKPPIEIYSDTVGITADPRSGILEMGWEPDGSFPALSGQLQYAGGALTLVMGDTDFTLRHKDLGHAIEVSWPFQGIRAGLTAYPGEFPGDYAPICFRPTRFDASLIATRVEAVVSPAALRSVGAESFWPSAGPEERLALAWAVLQNLRYG